jgi:hypothetical protein
VKQARGAIFLAILVGALSASITVLFLSMRSVMNIGGSCGAVDVGDGISIRPCPGNVAGLLPGAIWAGLIATGLYVFVASKFRVPSMVSLAWPALFLSLGYNFFDYGIHGQSGFVICGVVFVLMGGMPLIWALPHLWNAYVRGFEDDPAPWHVSTTGAAVGSAVNLLDRLGKSPSEDMTDSLERLDELHKKGALDDLEYAKAKDRVISGEDT